MSNANGLTLFYLMVTVAPAVLAEALEHALVEEACFRRAMGHPISNGAGNVPVRPAQPGSRSGLS